MALNTTYGRDITAAIVGTPANTIGLVTRTAVSEVNVESATFVKLAGRKASTPDANTKMFGMVRHSPTVVTGEDGKALYKAGRSFPVIVSGDVNAALKVGDTINGGELLYLTDDMKTLTTVKGGLGAVAVSVEKVADGIVSAKLLSNAGVYTVA